ncbi:MAG TPA: alpha/beta hydrolase, partial [Dissulfurispiraceae bacterium]
KLIMVDSGGFTEEYAARTQETRMNRLKPEEKAELKRVLEVLKASSDEMKNGAFSRMGELFSRVDWFDPIEHTPEQVQFRADIFQSVWKEAMEMRGSGRLLEMAREIRCPTVAIHGNYDSHPAEGVERPLSGILRDFRFILLENCGHKPWIERQARDHFYAVLRDEITSCLCYPDPMRTVGNKVNATVSIAPTDAILERPGISLKQRRSE